MMARGLTVDGTYLATTIAEMVTKEEDIKARLREFGITRPAQNAEVSRALMAAGVALPGRTATGQVSVAKDVLTEVDHEIAHLVLDYRYTHKVRVSYLEKLLEPALDPLTGEILPRGTVHPEIKPMEARTGRTSVSNPPMQQLPRDDKTVRNAVVPRRPGEVLVSADYGQIEMRMWARLTQDPGLIAAFRTSDEQKQDFFVTVGRDVYGDPSFSKADPRRALIKGVGYGTIYGASVDTLARTAKVEVSAMAPVAAAMKLRYPSMASLGMDMVSARDGGWEVTAPSGRRIRVRDRNEARKLPNYLVQGESAVILKRALVLADAAGLGDYLVLPVHDEIVMSVPEREAEEAAATLKWAMEAAVPEDGSGVTIPAEPGKPGHRWGELK
jgi:DNA polymerase-1